MKSPEPSSQPRLEFRAVWGAVFKNLKAPTPKVAPLKASLSILLIWLLDWNP